ncbi:MAG: M15 family peptidase, partial [Verrucomicrobiaceae bacterium]
SRLVLIELPGCMRYEGIPVRRARVHARCAESLSRVLASLASTHPAILGEFAGVFNDRAMRGGSTPSLHARGAAIDLAPDSNGNRTHWPLAATMSFEVMEAFAKEGWLPAGAFWGRDAMHFQATR